MFNRNRFFISRMMSQYMITFGLTCSGQSFASFLTPEEKSKYGMEIGMAVGSGFGGLYNMLEENNIPILFNVAVTIFNRSMAFLFHHVTNISMNDSVGCIALINSFVAYVASACIPNPPIDEDNDYRDYALRTNNREEHKANML